jgi:CRP-like cAMP-binding protein
MAAAKKSTKKKTSATSISKEELVREFAGAKTVTFKAGTTFLKEGSKAESCYVITQGRVQILKKTNKGESIPLAVVKPGEFLGEMAMLSGERRSASAIALTKVEAIVIEHAEFVSLLKAKNPFAGRLSLQLSTLLATRCHRLLRLIAHQPAVIPLGSSKVPPIDVRAVLNRVYTLWAV